MHALRKVMRAFAAIALAGFATFAHADLVTTDGQIVSFNWSFQGTSYLMQGTGTMTVTGLNSSSLTIVVTLYNNTVTTDSDGGDARLTSFGFGTDPNATSVAFSDVADGGMVGAALDSIPSLSLIEVCAFGGNNCPGGSNGGIYGDGTASAPGTDTFSLTLAGTWGASMTIDPIGFKYQTKEGSYEFTTTSSGGPPNVVVPEPATLALLGLGLAGLGMSRRKRAG